ncbi:hypothetical protein FEE95_15290 [Maribacter algarum]|uniref:Uncharacterized protein n=1 Tax=Maribacter algarum (ex Zhang et al. 2020) TaxID=2578118 RepID=A0A5S3PQR6_9FLAO|nr:hypothetical protein [Maribacter algarum]TMM56005.1 hypothetical protein FEE95_15290 [Maribacter algarum]
MKYPKIIMWILMGMFLSLNAQNATDQLYLTNGETIAVNVKKVEPNTITYFYLGEDLENVVEKDDVIKIVFKSGREQKFSGALTSPAGTKNANYEYPPMKVNQGAVLPFEFIFEGQPSSEEGIEAQEYYYRTLQRKPERNTITYQDPEITWKRLRKAGITEASQIKNYDMDEISKIVGVGTLVNSKIVVSYRSTVSNSTGSSTVRVDKKKRVKGYSSEYSTSRDEFETMVYFKIYDKNGNKVMDEKRRPFMTAGRTDYILTLSYFLKRTPFYQKNR